MPFALVTLLMTALSVASAVLWIRAARRVGALESRFKPVLDIEKEQLGLRAEKEQLEVLLIQLRRQAAQLGIQVQSLEEELVLRANGFYKPVYAFASSEMYQARLDEIRDRQKRMLKDKTAATCPLDWQVNGSAAEGRRHIERMLKLMLRAFNGECDAAVAKVSYKNIKAMEFRINNAAKEINGLAAIQKCEIKDAYVMLKLEELRLAHEYQDKLQSEREEQKRLREQMRDEEAARREFERAKAESEREERRYADALAKAREEVLHAEGQKQEVLQHKMAELERRLAEAQEKQRAISQAQLTKSGHVYVISNIGSFGEDVYKIGMTRRLVPQDRIDELGDASVPFEFDVHAVISTSDAPSLENALHRIFHSRRVNRINERKEFFRVTLDEISDAVRRHHGNFELTRVAEAEEYRKTLALMAEEERLARRTPEGASTLEAVA